jgi:hypothetical protein
MQQPNADAIANPKLPTSAQATNDIVVARGPYGEGFVIVKGFSQLRAQLERNGVADAFFQSTKQRLRVRKNSIGDLVQAIENS